MNGMRSPHTKRRTAAASIIALALAAVEAGPVAGTVPSRAGVRSGKVAGVAEASPKPAFGSLPVSFEPNVGQAPEGVKFLTRGAPASLTRTGAVLEGGGRPVTLAFVGASARARIAGADELPGKANYLVGSDPAAWRTNVPTYSSVRVDGLYAGVDLVWYGKGRSLEYDVVLAAGVDPGTVAFRLEGAPSPEVSADGALVAGDVRLERPVAYQEVAGARRAVACAYATRDDGRVGFLLGDFDRSLALVIDPEIAFSFPFADSTRDITVSGVAIDQEGAVYVVGSSRPAGTGTRDAMISKLNAAGTALEYSTTVGGSGEEQAYDIAVDAAGNAYVTGETTSGNFPATAGAFQTAFASSNASDPDAFVLELGPAGDSLLYASYLGGAKFDHGKDIVIDVAGNAYVVGTTTSTNFPTTEPAQAGNGGLADAFMTIVNPTGTARVRSTYLGGSESENGEGIAIDPAGNVYVVGATFSTDFPVTAGALQSTFGGGIIDAFWAKYTPAGQRVASTYLGGTGVDLARAVAVDAAGNSFLTGETDVTDFPAISPAVGKLTGGSRDAFVVQLNVGGSEIEFSISFGGSQYESGNAIDFDSDGLLYVAGETYSSDLPLVDPIQVTFGGGISDAFLLECDPSVTGPNAVEFCTYDGDERTNFGVDCAVGPNDEVCVVSTSPDLSPDGSENDEGAVTEYQNDSRPACDLAIFSVGVLVSKVDLTTCTAHIGITIESTDGCDETIAPDASFELKLPDGLTITGAEPVGRGVRVVGPETGVNGLVRFQCDRPVPAFTNNGFVDGDVVGGVVYVTFLGTLPTPFYLDASCDTTARECIGRNNYDTYSVEGQPGQVGNLELFVEPQEGDVKLAGVAPRVRLIDNSGSGARVTSGRVFRPQPAVGYRVYSSTQPNVQPIPSNLFTSVPPGTGVVDVTSAPAGSFFVVTATDETGESPPSNEVGGQLPAVSKLKVSASKIVVQGTGFANDVKIYFGGVPFLAAPKLKGGNTKVVQKGPLVTGQSLNDVLNNVLNPGSTTVVLLVNGNGNGVAVEYTR